MLYPLHHSVLSCRGVVAALGAIALSLCTAAVSAEDIVDIHPDAAAQAWVSIIIDDLGYGLDSGQALADSPYAITLAIIPFTPHGRDIAELAHKQDKEVMLHAPMETMSNTRWEAGLTTEMNEDQIITRMGEMLDNIPFVQGVNNHGGSKLTQDSGRMGWIMSYLAQRHLYFVDSRTISTSVASDAANQADIPNDSRDVFLDNVKDEGAIRKQIDKLRQIALKNGRAIGIGHPYDETLAALEKELPRFERAGIKLVKVSDLIQTEAHDAIVLITSSTLN